MNYIDITQNKHTHCVQNKTVVITNREGIQGPAGKDGSAPEIGPNGTWIVDGVDTKVPARGGSGKDGFSPYISAETGNWVTSTGDTGIPATGGGSSGGGDVKEIVFYYSTAHFPQSGVANVIYVDKSSTKMYAWDEWQQGYIPYNEDDEDIIYCGSAFE
jgi:hypothetical protein